MASNPVSERQILEALQRVPVNRWPEVLRLLNDWREEGPAQPAEGKPIRTLGDILNSGLVGLWADRTDIPDNHEFARELRRQASRRAKGTDAPGQ